MKTITVSAPGQTGAQDSSSANTAGASGKLSGGSIAGIVVGVIGGLALIGALIFLVFFYRKRARSASPIPSTVDTAEHRASQASSFSRGVFPQGHSHDLSGSSTLGRKHTFTDNRMKTDMYPNGARDSSVSLQDNEDYSRPVLRVSTMFDVNFPGKMAYSSLSSPTPTKFQLDNHMFASSLTDAHGK